MGSFPRKGTKRIHYKISSTRREISLKCMANYDRYSDSPCVRSNACVWSLFAETIPHIVDVLLQSRTQTMHGSGINSSSRPPEPIRHGAVAHRLILIMPWVSHHAYVHMMVDYSSRK